MVQVNGVEVSTTETTACLDDLLSAAKIRPRSAAFNYITKKIEKVHKEVSHGKTWITFGVATDLFSGFKFSKEVASLSLRSTEDMEVDLEPVSDQDPYRQPAGQINLGDSSPDSLMTDQADIFLGPGVDPLGFRDAGDSQQDAHTDAMALINQRDRVGYRPREDSEDPGDFPETPSVEMLAEIAGQMPDDANMWLHVSDACLNWSLDAESLLYIGLEKLIQSNRCEQRVPFILNMVEHMIQSHPDEPYRPLELVTSVLASGADLDTKETHCLDRLALYLFQNCLQKYEPSEPLRLESVASIPPSQQHTRALALVSEYRDSLASAKTQDEKLYFVSRVEAVMERYFVDLPRQGGADIWTTYSKAWALYVGILEDFGIEAAKIFASLDHIYTAMPQYARDNLVGEYARLLSASGNGEEALRILDEWVDGGKTGSPTYTKEVLKQHTVLLLEADRASSRHEALWPYLVRFRDSGVIWSALVTLEYHVGTRDTAHQLAELGLEQVQGAAREHIWLAYLQDTQLTPDERSSILARYFSEFQTPSAREAVEEFLGEPVRDSELQGQISA